MKRSSTRKTSSPKAKSARKNKSTKPAEAKLSRTHKPDNMELEEWQTLLRKQFAESQQFRLENLGEHPLFSTFKLTNLATDRSYRLAIRGVNPAVLEQRIARVHRMGQKKNVRVVNFISKDSIEERILDLLRFKASLCTGALDADGEDQVMVGQSQLERFMESVEAATDDLPVQDKEQLRQEQAEEERETAVLDNLATGSERTHTAETPAANPLQELLKSGAQLLSGLSDALGSASADTDKAGNNPADMVARFIERDEATGKSHLKIPLPEPAVMQSVFSGLEKLFAAFGGGGKG